MSYQRPTRLMNRDFLLLWQGQFVSMLGSLHALSLGQLSTPPELRGRVLGLFETLGLSTMPIAAATAGIVADLLHRNIPLVYSAAAWRRSRWRYSKRGAARSASSWPTRRRRKRRRAWSKVRILRTPQESLT